jgi:hypothetical protein
MDPLTTKSFLRGYFKEAASFSIPVRSSPSGSCSQRGKLRAQQCEKSKLVLMAMPILSSSLMRDNMQVACQDWGNSVNPSCQITLQAFDKILPIIYHNGVPTFL